MNRCAVFLVAALVVVPSIAAAQCGGDSACSVGAAGTGGQNSDGNAQGFRQEILLPGGTLSNSGNSDAGRLRETGSTGTVGTLSGTFRENPQPSVRGAGTGIFGDWAGQCADDFPFDDC